MKLSRFRLKSIRGRTVIIATAAVVLLGGSGAFAATYLTKHAGPSGDGTGVTPVGFRVTPVGKQTTLGSLPVNAVFSPDHRFALVANAGDGVQSLEVVSTATSAVTQTISYHTPEAIFAGLAFSPDGAHAYASGGGDEKIRVYSVSNGQLTEQASIPLPTTNPAGQSVNLYPAGLAATPDGKHLVVADQLADAVTVVDLTTGATNTIGVDHDPYGVALSPDGGTAYVTNQGGNTVSVLDVHTGSPVLRDSVTVGTHPNQELLDPTGRRLYVSNGDSDQVSVLDTATHKVIATVNLAPYPNAPVGANPDGLALSPDGRTLYVANSGDNDVAEVDLGSNRVAGLIPTAWYPTAVLATGNTLLAVSAKGLGAGPNPNGPNPYTDDQLSGTPAWQAQYVGSMMMGTLSTINGPRDPGQLARWTAQVVGNDGFNLGDAVRGTSPNASAIVPAHIGQSSPIKHVIYVVKENRTFDQEFGSIGKGNGDPSLDLFGDDSATNLRALEKRFVTLDNFYANAEVSAQGWNWAVASNSNSYSEQTWVANYSNRNHSYPSESGDPAIAPNRNPADAYVWDRLADNGVSFRNYGFYVSANAANQMVAADPRLEANTDPHYRGFDLSCPDSANSFAPQSPNCGTPRIEEWKKEFAGYVAGDNLPSVEFVRLPNDHTSSTAPGRPTPTAYVGDNDWSVGQLVDTISHSKYWRDTAIFVTEDDAQAGPDHVDAHRTTSEVISPYTQTGNVDSTFYNTAAMLRTIELLVGIKPLTQFDAYATPMINSFTNRPNFAPYNAVKPSTSLTAVNGPGAPMAAQSAMQNFSVEDAINEQIVNQAIWESVKGANSQMPAPRSNGVPMANPPTGAPTAPSDGDGH